MDLFKSFSVCILLYLTVIISLSSAANDKPIIGVLAQATFSAINQFGDTYIAASYVKFLESAGARVVPILTDQPDAYYKMMFSSLNGVLYPGGGVDDLLHSGYGKAGKYFYEMSIKNFDASGDYFPVWGTCLGFELLTMLTAKEGLLANVDADKVSWPLTFTKDFQDGPLYNPEDESVLRILKYENVTYNHHQFGLTPTNFSKSSALKKFYRVLSTNLDSKGIRFISSMEAFKYPIYGIQFHPEKNIFEWLDSAINHSADAVKIAQYFANFVVAEARRSNHAFTSQAEQDASLIYNYSPVYIGNITSFEQAYFFSP